MNLTPIGFILGAYLLGAIPFGLLIGWARGVDVRKQGSGNIGATNVGRVLGKPAGFLCLALDIAKGLVPTLLAGRVLVQPPFDAAMIFTWITIGLAAVLGHTFPIYLGFRGGKGVSTTIGAALGIYPVYTAAMTAGVLAYAIVRFSTGFASLGSIVLAVVFPVAVITYVRMYRFNLAVYWPMIAVAIVLALLIIVRHRGNLVRLLRGEEPRAGAPPVGGPTP